MGGIVVDLTVENLLDPSRRITCNATVDAGLMLPKPGGADSVTCRS
jgi:hypothetical protein